MKTNYEIYKKMINDNKWTRYEATRFLGMIESDQYITLGERYDLVNRLHGTFSEMIASEKKTFETRPGQKTITVWAVIVDLFVNHERHSIEIEIGTREEMEKAYKEKYNFCPYCLGSKSIKIGSKDFKRLGLEVVPKN